MPTKLLFLQTLIDFDADWNSNNRLMFAPKLDKSKVRCDSLLVRNHRKYGGRANQGMTGRKPYVP